MISSILAVIGAIGVVSLAIFVHELGHFLAARSRGVGVDAFAIGMGPKIFAWTRGGTEYSLRWLPVGGFVKLHQMLPEEAEEIDEADSERKSIGKMASDDMEALYDKGFVTKFMVFTGGVFFNFLAAIVAVALIYMIGFDQPMPGPAWVADVPEGSPVAAAGLLQGDTIIGVQGKAVNDQMEVEDSIAEALEIGSASEGWAVRVARGDEELDLMLPPLTNETLEGYFTSWAWEYRPYIGGVIPMKPAANAGIVEGDLVVAINGNPITRWTELSNTVRASLGQVVEFEVEREGEEQNLVLAVEPVEDVSDERKGTGIIGIIPGTGRSKFVRENPVVAAINAPLRAYDRLALLTRANYEAITQSSFAELKDGMGGPVMIANLTYRESKKGIVPMLWWFMTLNLLLAIMNLLPIPVLDGGFIAQTVIEAVIRRPIPMAIIGPVYTLCAICLIALIALISIQDLFRWAQ